VAAKAGQSSVQKEDLSQDIVLAQKEEVSQGIILEQEVLQDMDSDAELYHNSACKSNAWQKWNGTCRIEPEHLHRAGRHRFEGVPSQKGRTDRHQR